MPSCLHCCPVPGIRPLARCWELVALPPRLYQGGDQSGWGGQGRSPGHGESLELPPSRSLPYLARLAQALPWCKQLQQV